MSYTIPTFNLPVNIWRFGSDVADPPDVTAMGNLTGGRNGVVARSPGIGLSGTTVAQQALRSGKAMCLLLPKLTDVRTGDNTTSMYGDCIEVPAGTGRYYAVVQVDDIGKGFANEHRFAMIVALNGLVGADFGDQWEQPLDWPVPYP